MKHLFQLPILSLLLLGAASADDIKVPLVGLDWQVAFEAPTLKQSTLEYTADFIRFKANSGRFNVSLFVEPPPPGATKATNAACRDFYWPQGKRNPAIVPESIQQGTAANCEFVTYRAKGEFQGVPYEQDHVNCFFVHQGKWMDLHASIITPTAEDTKLLGEFGKHVTFGPWQASKGKPEKFVFDGLGAVNLTPPEGWLTGNLLKDDSGDLPPRFTLSFFSPTDRNSNCLLTFFAMPNAPTGIEEMRGFVLNATKDIASASVEGKSITRDLKFKQGYGAVASFTDASLVGKPAQPGNAKALASGYFVPKTGTLGVISMFMDDAKGIDAAKMLQAVESVTLE